MDEQTQLLREILTVLRVIAEPALAKQDEKLRASLSQVVGKSKGRARAVMLMDGTRAQRAISVEAKLDPGDASRLVKQLREKGLLADGDLPRVVIPVPSNFFESTEKANG